MKKVWLIFGSLVAFFALERLVLIPLKPSLNEWINGSVTKNMFVQFLIELIMLLAFIGLNRRFIQQKILMEYYPYVKGFGLMWYSWLILATTYVAFSSGLKQNHLGLSAILLILIVALLVGITEEYIFRGLILGRLVSSGRSVLVALIVSSTLFACTHFINLLHNSLYNVSLQVLYAIPLGAFLGLLYLKSNNILYPILAHAIQDFAAFFISGGKMDSTSATPNSVLQIYILFGIIILAYYLTGKKQLVRFANRLETEKISHV